MTTPYTTVSTTKASQQVLEEKKEDGIDLEMVLGHIIRETLSSFSPANNELKKWALSQQWSYLPGLLHTEMGVFAPMC